jgi:hypothetical protein
MKTNITKVEQSLPKINTNPTIETRFIRNITSIVDKANETTHYYLVCHASEIGKFAVDMNLRDFYGCKGSAKKITPIHNDIRHSFIHNFERFKLLHSGFTVIADKLSEDITKSFVDLKNAQLINGAQSQGVIVSELKGLEDEGIFDSDWHRALVTIEIIITNDRELRNDICNSRNSQNKVQYASLMESKHIFDDLRIKMGMYNPSWTISGRETTQTDIPVAKLIQVTRLFLTDDLMDESKVKQAYVGSLSCLKAFEKWHNENNEIYNFIINFAPIAWEQYLKWNSHTGWKNNSLREDFNDPHKKPIGKKLENGNWTDIHQGVIFPLLRGLHVFVTKKGNKYVFKPTAQFNEDRMIKRTIQYYREDSNNDPQTMGKDSGSYRTLSQFADGREYRV